MKKNIDLIIDGIAPKKVMYDTDNHSLVVLYPAQKEFKVRDKVRLKKDLDLKLGECYNGLEYHDGIDNAKDAILTIDMIDEFDGSFKAYNNIDGDWWWYRPEWLEHIVEDEVKFKRGDILVSDNLLLIFDEYATYNKEKDVLHSLWNNTGMANKNWTTKYFKHATDEQIAQVHELLRKDGKRWNEETLEVEDLDISEIVVDLESACEYLKKPIPNFSSLFCSSPREDYFKYSAQIALQLIREAWNKFDGFVVDFEDKRQVKYSPRIDLDGNIACAMWWIDAHNIHSSCHSFPTEKRARQFGNQFKDLLKTAMGM